MDAKRENLRDSDFDRLFSPEYQNLSSRHWTPLAVSRIVGQWIHEHCARKVLDVGSGAGKFCLTVGDLCPDTHFTGVENNLNLVREARAVAEKLERKNVRFVHGDSFTLDWEPFDLFYFYNPFLEPSEFTERCVARTQEKLAVSPAGTKVITYYGFGGDLPQTYSLTRTLFIADGPLELWEKNET